MRSGWLEGFPLDLLTFGQECICLSKINTDIASDITLDNTCHYFFFHAEILIVNHFPFFFTDLL